MTSLQRGTPDDVVGPDAALPRPLRRLASQYRLDDVQRPTPGAPYAAGRGHTPVFDDLHRAIHLDDPIRTTQVRMLVVGVERVLRGTAAVEVRRDAIAAVVAVLARAYASDSITPTTDHDALSRLRMAFANLARKYFGAAAEVRP